MKLLGLKPFLDDLMSASSVALDLETTVINADPIMRISGSGKYRVDLNTKWSKSYTLQAITQKKAICVIDTQSYEFAAPENNTKYYSVIIQPIFDADEVAGAIVIASFSKEQQDILLAKKDGLIKYLEKIALLISSKITEEKLLGDITDENEQLLTVLASVKEGLLLYSISSGILQINERAKEKLGFQYKISKAIMEEIHNICVKSHKVKEILQKEIHYNNGKNDISCLVQTRPIGRKADVVLCAITSFGELQDVITQNLSEEQGSEIITINKKMQQLKEKAIQIAKNNSNVLILGESGTGKELLARAIHFSGSRKGRPFVTVNCAAIPESLLESELFGYEEGAFTGAKKGGRIGKFLLADTGTLFLDEIGDMPLYLQAKLLRVLSDRKIDRIGSSSPLPVDIRVLAATNKNLEEMIEKKEFREDLYYRLSVIEFKIPPLRERKDDIELLVNYFICKYNNRLHKNIKGITENVKNTIIEYEWKGNVRELENAIEYMVNFESEEYITMANVPQKLLHITNDSVEVEPQKYFNQVGDLRSMVEEYEQKILMAQTSLYGGKPDISEIKKICKNLNISQATYYRKLNNSHK